MGFITTFKNVVSRVKHLNSEARSVNPSGVSWNFVDYLERLYSALSANSDDAPVTTATAMRISTFFTCVLVRAESLATLPASVLQSTSKGSIKSYNHPAHYLLHDRPNPFQTASDFWKTVSAHIDIFGEAIGIISWSGRWTPTAINLIAYPSEVDIIISDGRPWFQYNGVIYEDWQILHFKDLSLDGIRGCSKVRYNAETLGYAKKLRNYGKQAVGVKPPGYFTTSQPYDILQKQQENLAKGWKENIAAGKTPFLPLGLEYKNLIINPDDAQFLEAIEATKEDICGFMRVPPTLVQNYRRATFSNAEQQDLVFIKYTMLPPITNIEQECKSKLFSESNKTSAEPYYVKFNTNAFMRGDFKSRAEGYRILFNIGAIDGDTIAELEDWNRWEGGDQRFVMMNMMPLNRVNEVVDSMIKAGEKAEPVKDDQERTIGYRIGGFYMPVNESGDPNGGGAGGGKIIFNKE